MGVWGRGRGEDSQVTLGLMRVGGCERWVGLNGAANAAVSTDPRVGGGLKGVGLKGVGLRGF